MLLLRIGLFNKTPAEPRFSPFFFFCLPLYITAYFVTNPAGGGGGGGGGRGGGGEFSPLATLLTTPLCYNDQL